MKLIAILLCFSLSSYACDYPEKVSKGEVVKCDGVIATNDQAIDYANNKKDLRILRVKVRELEDINGLRERQLTSAAKQTERLQNDLQWTQAKTVFFTVGSFLLGAFAMGYAAKEFR